MKKVELIMRQAVIQDSTKRGNRFIYCIVVDPIMSDEAEAAWILCIETDSHGMRPLADLPGIHLHVIRQIQIDHVRVR